MNEEVSYIAIEEKVFSIRVFGIIRLDPLHKMAWINKLPFDFPFLLLF
jgi:hypothetical protein